MVFSIYPPNFDSFLSWRKEGVGLKGYEDFSRRSNFYMTIESMRRTSWTYLLPFPLSKILTTNITHLLTYLPRPRTLPTNLQFTTQYPKPCLLPNIPQPHTHSQVTINKTLSQSQSVDRTTQHLATIIIKMAVGGRIK